MRVVDTIQSFFFSLVQILNSIWIFLVDKWKNFNKTYCADCGKYLGNFGFYVTDFICENCADISKTAQSLQLGSTQKNLQQNSQILEMEELESTDAPEDVTESIESNNHVSSQASESKTRNVRRRSTRKRNPVIRYPNKE